MNPDSTDNLAALLLARAEGWGELVAFSRRRAGEGESCTYGDFARAVRGLGTELVARGLNKGDRVALVAETSRDWFLADLAVAAAGGVTVPRGADTSLPELLTIISHSQPRWVIVEGADLARRLRQALAEASLPEEILLLRGEANYALECVEEGNGKGREQRPGKGQGNGQGERKREREWEGEFTDLEELTARGLDRVAQGDCSLTERLGQVGGEDLLTVVYTSGTTGDPRGVMLTHGNVLANVQRLPEICLVHAGEDILSILPSWHMFERTVDYYALSRGCRITFSNRRGFRKDLAGVRPTLMVSVPRIWEAIHNSAVHKLGQTKGLKGWLLRRVFGLLPGRGLGTLTPLQRLTMLLCHRLCRRRVAAAFGGRLCCAVSGGGALPRELDAFFVGAGIPLLNGYGLTETGPVVCARRADCNRPGGVGRLLSDTEVEIRDRQGRPLARGEQGVIHVRGPQVMVGYYRNPQATARALSPEGWFDTGDLGHLDEKGELHITGRAKETIVLAGGENVEPAPLESILLSSPLISQVMIYGQDQKRLSALVVPDLASLSHRVPREQWEEQEGLLQGAAPRAALKAELDRLCIPDAGFRSCERIGNFQLLNQAFSEDNGMLTATQKVRRHKVLETYRDLLDRLGP